MYYIILIPVIYFILDTYKKNSFKINNKLQELDETNYDLNW